MRFKDGFPFLTDLVHTSPAQTPLRHLAARFWYPKRFRVSISFTLKDDLDVGHAPADRLLVDLWRREPYDRFTKLGDETKLAEQTVATEYVGATYTSDSGISGSLAGGAITYQAFPSLYLFCHEQLINVLEYNDEIPTVANDYTGLTGKALQWFDDLTGTADPVICCNIGAQTAADSDYMSAASFDWTNPAAYLPKAVSTDNVVVFRPPNNHRIDFPFEMTHDVGGGSPSGLHPTGWLSDLSVYIVEWEYFSYGGTSPSLDPWDWGDL